MNVYLHYIGLNFKQVESNKISITWTLYKSASSIFASLYNNEGTLKDTATLDGESREAIATLGARGTVYTVTVKPTYVDGTSATGRIDIWTSY